MRNQSDIQTEQNIYVCPTCKSHLSKNHHSLFCQICKVSYPISNHIPDFILKDLSQSSNPTMRGVQSIDRLARIYESRWWYPLVLNLYGGWGSTTLEQLVDTIRNMLEPGTERIIDIACGPGTFGRCISSQTKEVYGIDISMGMLYQGAIYAEKEQVYNMHFSRAQVEALPFKDNFFDAAICCGALHLFEEPVKALKEINRTMKEGASLAAFTFFAGNAGILRFRRIREHVRKDHGVHIFEIPEIENYTMQAGFEMFKPEVYGSVLAFSVRKVSGR
jgi:ubiquinone/menaquinone biosynthesis C-methylase UbiE/uncharacterized protein YbaR (Trm112 family)